MATARDTLGLKPHQEIRAEIEKLKGAYKTLASSGKLSMAELAQAKVVLRQRIAELKNQTNGWASGLEKVKTALAGMVAAGAAFLLPIREAMQFESAMSAVAKVVDAPKEKIDALGQKLVELTRTLPLTVIELAAIAEAGGQMGIAAGDIETFVVTTAKIASAFQMTAEDAGTAIGKLKNLYKLTIPDVEKLADAINVLGNNTNAVERDITKIVVEVGGMAQIFGLTGRQAAALSSAFLSLGVPVNMVDTSISAMLSKLQAANVATPEFKAALNSIGISADQLARDIAENPQKALMRFLETLKQLDNKDLSEKLIKLFGLEYQKNIAVLIQGLDQYKQALKLVENDTETAGAVNREFERGLGTLENKIHLARNAVKELAIHLGMLSIAKQVVSLFTDMVKGMADFARAHPVISNIVLAIGALTAGLSALGLIFSGLFLLFGKAVTALGSLGAALGGVLSAATGLSAGLAGLLALLTALSAVNIYRLIKTFREWLDLQPQIDLMSKAYREKAGEFEAYKDVQIKGLNELKLMSDEQLRNEYENLQKSLSYWIRYRAGLETKAAEHTTAGFIFTSPIRTEEAKQAQAELEGVNKKIDELTEAHGRLGEAARANNVELRNFKESATVAARGAIAATADTKKFVLTLEDAMASVSDLTRQHDLMASSLARSYDFAAERAGVLAVNEKEAARQVVEIERQKKDTLLGLANEIYRQKLSLLQKAVGDEKSVNESIKTITRDMTDAKKKAVDEWLGKLKSAYLTALADERKYAAEVKALNAERVSQRRTTEEMIREARRQTMSEEQAWRDKQKQAAETLRAAYQAISGAEDTESLEKARQLAEKARNEFSGLAGEVKSGDQVIISMQKTVEASTKGMMDAQRAIDSAIQKQISLAEQNRKDSENQAKSFHEQWEENKKLLDELNSMEVKPTAEIQVNSSAVDAKLNELESTVTHSTHVVHVQTVQESAAGGPVVAFAEGGWSRLRGKLSGYGGGDRIRALLEAGEFIIRKEAVSKYGAGLFHALNAMRLNVADLVANAMPRLPALPRAGYATGGPVSAANYGTLRLQAGGVELPVQVPGPRGREMVREFERELRKERLVRGR